MWILLLKICLLTTLFYSLYHWALRGNTFFRFNRVYLLAGMFIALALPFIPLYYAVPTVSETDLPETAFRIGNIISIEMKVNESVNFSQIGCLIYISGLIVLLLSRMWTVFRLFRCIRNGSKEVFCGIVSIETPMVQSSFSFLRYIVLPQGIKEVDKNVILAHEETHIRQWHCVDLLLGDIFCIIQWFNPIAWLYKRDLVENHEFLADSNAGNVAGMDVYKETLTRYWLYGTMKSLVNPFAYSTRLMRLSMLKKPSSHDIQKCWTVALVPLLLLYVWIFAVPVSSAEVTDLQQVTLMGKITDETGQKIVAASVFVPQKSFGTISDIDGNYQLSVGKKDTVYVSIAGYEKQKICVSDYAVENGKLMIDVLLQSLK